MTVGRPKVSVIIPTYNSAQFVGQAVASVYGQTYSDFELIVVDDGSTDDTWHVLEPYRERMRYLYQPNMGESVARNRGIQESHGEYIAFLDADDLWLPSKLAKQIALMDQHPSAVLVYSPSYWINTAGDRIFHHGSYIVGTGTPGLADVFPQLAMGDMMASPSCVVVRSSYLRRGQAFDPRIRHSEDWDLWLRLSLQGPFLFVPEPLACYRIHHPKRRLATEAAPEYVQQNVQIIEAIFAAAALLRPQWAGLKHQALGFLFLRSAMYNAELGNLSLAAEHLANALEVYPAFEQDILPQRVAQEAFRLALEAGDYAVGLKFIEMAFANFPATTRQTTRQRRSLQVKALACFWEILAFDAYSNNQPGAVWRNVIRVLRLQPRRIQNRGLIAITVRSLLRTKFLPPSGGTE